ncbi:MAG TPA: hypothetical protein VM802_25410 [Chitinophaga sp.]|uniref:hypothetical protein n=1 Tax=Chitinophaga sp. TaxID=1869181 RepID=UPI002C31081A|nr:hypothetical protein [Chitinophaga sp.]HVI48231.1 hypothetical protein [Chitinophaga sp.]
MAKIDLPAGVRPAFMGTIQNLCIYEMHGRYYIRLKSSLTGKRVKKDPAFRRTMENAGLLATASKMASGVYRQLPQQYKKHILYRQLTGRALLSLKAGKSPDVIVTELMEMCQPTTVVKPVRKSVVRRSQAPALWRYGSKVAFPGYRKRHVTRKQVCNESVYTQRTDDTSPPRKKAAPEASLCFWGSYG